jgi:hypothetical protein
LLTKVCWCRARGGAGLMRGVGGSISQ